MRLGLALVLLATPVFAAKQHAEPPASYVNAFKGQIIEIPVEPGQAYRACQQLGPNVGGYLGQLGCSLFGKGSEAPDICVIVWTKGKPHVRRHEKAHCAGWTHP